jgi:hypothetical protein
MSERPPRLGDVIDDYCPRCRLLLNHDVVSLYGGQVAKVACRTCHNGHDYRQAQVPPKRKRGGPTEKQKLMDEVLAGMGVPASSSSATPSSPAAVADTAPVRPNPSPEPAPVAPPTAAANELATEVPLPRKRGNLWAELERIRQKK